MLQLCSFFVLYIHSVETILINWIEEAPHLLKPSPTQLFERLQCWRLTLLHPQTVTRSLIVFPRLFVICYSLLIFEIPFFHSFFFFKNCQVLVLRGLYFFSGRPVILSLIQTEAGWGACPGCRRRSPAGLHGRARTERGVFIRLRKLR